MIVYNKLWQTMKEKKISQYTLIKDTLNRLCSILDCRLSDIAEYIRDEEILP